MWRLVFSVVLWNTITSQPVTDDPDITRQPRQLDFECCPCPGSSRAGFEDIDPMGWAPAARAAVDDCPCRLRDADSEGSPSVFLPRAMRPFRPDMRLQDTKEAPKPLLHPEVDLASSVLETLREVTDEEYQDALARDAARNAARVSELRDAKPEAAKNIIIVVNPEDDATPEASHAHEMRYIHPLHSTLGQVRETGYKPPVFNLAPGYQNFDMVSAASDAQENIAGMNKGLEGLKLKTTPTVLKLFANKKSNGEGNIQSLLKLRKTNNLPKDAQDKKELGKSLLTKVPTLKLPTFLNKKSLSLKPLNLNKLHFPKIKVNQARQPKFDVFDTFDSNPSPSDIQEQVADVSKTTSLPKFGLTTLLPSKSQLTLKNLLNLKDVELITPKINKSKITLPDLKLLPSLRINKLGTDFVKQCNPNSKKTCDMERKISKSNIQTIPRNQKMQTEILDAVPSPSETSTIAVTNDNGIESNPVGLIPNNKMDTEILDALPSASENNDVVVLNKNQVETTTPEFHDPTLTDKIPSSSKLSEDTTENGEVTDSGIELFTDQDDNSEFEEVEITEESDQPINEIEISGDGLNDPGKDINLEIFNGSDFDNQAINVDISEIESIVNQNENLESQEFEVEQIEPIETDDNETNFDLFRQNSVENQKNELEDAIADTNNQVLSIEPQLNVNTDRDFLIESEESSFTTNEPAQDKLESEPAVKDKLMSSVKEHISLKLNKFDKSNGKVLTISRFTIPEAAENKIVTNEKNSLNSDEFMEIEPLKEDTDNFPIVEKSSGDENTNSYLEQEARGSENVKCKCNILSDEFDHLDSLSGSNLEERVDEASTVIDDSDEIIPKSDDSISSAGSNTELMEFIHNTEDTNFNAGQDSIENNSDNERDTENFKSSEEKTKSAFDTSETNTSDDEMESEASESSFKTASQSPFLRQEIVQPSSLLPNLFGPIPTLDLSSLNSQLPTLDDITSGLSSILSGNQRAAVEQNLSSDEFDSNDECSNLEPVMSPDASTTSSKTSPSLNPLENINLDIFQVNPLTQAKIPSLNLNSFKTKLPLPKGLGLTPLKLESSLGGKNGGLVGAMLSFGPDKISSSRTVKPINKLDSILNLQGTDILGNPLARMPSLDELRSSMRSSSQNILNSPLTKQINDPIKDTLHATQMLGSSLRTHSENTMRNIQQTLESTLNEARVKDLNNAGSKFAKPQDLFEMVSSAHEDMNDKLRAIHTDLKDRLTSLNDRIIDQSNIPALKSPLLKSLGKLGENPLAGSNFRSGVKGIPTLLQSSRIQQKPKGRVSTKPTLRGSKPITKTKVMIASPQSRTVKEQNKLMPYKIPKAASSLTPKTVEVPKLMTTSSKPPFSRPLQRDSNVKLKETIPSFLTEMNTKRQQGSIARNQFKPFGDFKISISTTPRPANFRSRQQFTNHRREQSVDLPKGKLKSRGDSRGYASEVKSVQVPAPLNPITTENPLDFESDRPVFRASPASSRPITSSNSRPLKLSSKLPTLKSIPTLSLPKTTESPLVAKMRDAIRIRFSNRPKAEKVKSVEDSGLKSFKNDDMAKSASENREMMFHTEPMKENVSYKCKMVCVREP